ncbi:MAG: isochorismatase family protein, partial [Oscillibacter sp.]|nr:isochorismatase family protein [Oscillibacter sp.]
MRKILLVIDMQNDFVDGALGTPEAAAIVDRAAAEIAVYPAGDVIATRDTHEMDYLKTQEGRN